MTAAGSARASCGGAKCVAPDSVPFGSQFCPQASSPVALGMARKGSDSSRLQFGCWARYPAQLLIITSGTDV